MNHENESKLLLLDSSNIKYQHLYIYYLTYNKTFVNFYLKNAIKRNILDVEENISGLLNLNKYKFQFAKENVPMYIYT